MKEYIKGNTANVVAIAKANLKAGRRFKCGNFKGFDFEEELDAFDMNEVAIEDLCDKKWRKLERQLREEGDEFRRILREVAYVHYYGY